MKTVKVVLDERHEKIRFLGKIIRQMSDKNVPFTYQKFVYFYLTRPNVKFQEDCRIIGIDPGVWNEKYRGIFYNMFVR